MSKVILSTGYEFTLADNGYGASDNSVNFTIICNDKTLEEIETAFTGVEEFKVALGNDGEDPNFIAKYYGFTAISEIAKYPRFSNGIDPETVEEIFNTAVTVVCIKKAVEDRLNDIEESVDDIVSAILGGDDLFPADEENEGEV